MTSKFAKSGEALGLAYRITEDDKAIAALSGGGSNNASEDTPVLEGEKGTKPRKMRLHKRTSSAPSTPLSFGRGMALTGSGNNSGSSPNQSPAGGGTRKLSAAQQQQAQQGQQQQGGSQQHGPASGRE